MERYAAFLWVVLSFLLVYWSILRAKRGIVPELRRLAALDMFSGAIKRCAEMGRPLMMLASIDTGGAFAGGAGQGMQILSTVPYISRLCAEQGTTAHISAPNPQSIPFVEDAIEVSCRAAGKPEEVNRQKVYCWGLAAPGIENFAACAEWIRNSYQMMPATSIVFVGGRPTCNYLDGSRSIEGNFIIGGTGDLAQAGWYVVMADYFIMPDEVMGMATYINKDPIQLNTFLIYDVFRVTFFGIIVVLAMLFHGGKVNIANILKA